jgi:hypothetical protein
MAGRRLRTPMVTIHSQSTGRKIRIVPEIPEIFQSRS